MLGHQAWCPERLPCRPRSCLSCATLGQRPGLSEPRFPPWQKEGAASGWQAAGPKGWFCAGCNGPHLLAPLWGHSQVSPERDRGSRYSWLHRTPPPVGGRQGFGEQALALLDYLICKQ